METHFKIATSLAKLFDNQFKVFGFRFGLDPLIGLIPALGDILPVAIGSYFLWIGIQMQMPKEKINQMIHNIALDFILGLIPLIGDASDFVFKAHTRNLAIIEDHRRSSPQIVEGEIIN